MLDYIFVNSSAINPGPFSTVSEFHDYFTLSFGPGRGIPVEGREPHPYRSTLPDDVPIVFTHADLHPSNILITRPQAQKGRSRVLSIIDWQQSGWYPAYWEYCKSRWTADIGGTWEQKYLPMIMDVADCYHNWDYFVLAYGM